MHGKDCKKYDFLYDVRGVTLIELLLVVAILSIFAGAATIGISLAYSRDAEQCAKTINNELETARMYSLSKKGTYILKVNLDQNTLTIDSSEDGTVLDKQLQKRVVISAEGGTVPIPDDAVISIEFDKSTGKVKQIQVNGSVNNCSVFTFKVENRDALHKASVVLIKNTGKHYLEF